jgi:hypothetical protein
MGGINGTWFPLRLKTGRMAVIGRLGIELFDGPGFQPFQRKGNVVIGPVTQKVIGKSPSLAIAWCEKRI